MNRTSMLFIFVAAGSATVDALAQARDAYQSSPFHRCVAAALAVKPGKVIETEQDREGGRPVYEIDILGNDGNRWEVQCDMTTIRILKVELETEDDDTPRTQPYSSPGQQGTEQSPAPGPAVQVIAPQPIFKVSEESAKQIALRQYPGDVTQVVYEYANGRPGYEIHIRGAKGTRIEVEIDGVTGEVMEVSEKPR